jgi:hypothetical protein
MRAHGRELYFHIATSDLKIMLCGIVGGWPKEPRGANGTDAFQDVASIEAVDHWFAIPKK